MQLFRTFCLLLHASRALFCCGPGASGALRPRSAPKCRRCCKILKDERSEKNERAVGLKDQMIARMVRTRAPCSLVLLAFASSKIHRRVRPAGPCTVSKSWTSSSDGPFIVLSNGHLQPELALRECASLWTPCVLFVDTLSWDHNRRDAHRFSILHSNCGRLCSSENPPKKLSVPHPHAGGYTRLSRRSAASL